MSRPTISPIPKNWNGPYIERDPIDPWGNSYIYSSPGKNRPDYDLYSQGNDAQAFEDDVTNWE